MVAGGNTTYTCKACGKEFVGWVSAKRLYCSRECSSPFHGAKAHGESRTRLYSIWSGMKNRCHCEGSEEYLYYGARGITVCVEWMNSYETFRDWAVANGYTETLEIDRRDVNGNYEPSNCRWATRLQQMANTRKRRDGTTSRFKGVSWCANVGKWRAQVNRNGTVAHVGLFRSELKAALAYDDAAFELRGEFARLNFPERKQSSISS